MNPEFEEQLPVWWRSFFTYTNFAYVWGAFVLFLLFVWYGTPERWSLTTMIADQPPIVWTFVAFLWVLFGLFRKAWLGLAITIPAFLAVFFLVLKPAIRFDSPGAGNVRVMSYDLGNEFGNGRQTALAIRRTLVDIVALQGLTYRTLEHSCEKDFRASMPGFEFVSTGDLLVATRFPIVGKEFLEAPGQPAKNGILIVTVSIGGKHVAIVNTNFRPYESRGEATKGQYRERLVENLLANLPKDVPVIVCGNFDGNPNGLVYRRLGSVLNDTFAERGVGLGYTTPSSLPSRRMEWIWASPDLKLADASIQQGRINPTQPTMATFYFPGIKVKRKLPEFNGNYPKPYGSPY